MKMIYEDEALAVDVIKAIHTGDVQHLKQLLAENPLLAASRIVERNENKNKTEVSRSLLHIVTDWPGHFANGAKTVKVLVGAGAEVNARFTGHHTETPLHWAASSDDIEVLDALLDSGANIEADGAVIGGGTPLDDAVAFGQWKAAHRLVDHGATTKLWNEAALGLMDRVKSRFESSKHPSKSEITQAFWLACHGNQRHAAEYLLKHGANKNWIGYDELTPLDAARRNNAHDLVQWLSMNGAKSAKEQG